MSQVESHKGRRTGCVRRVVIALAICAGGHELGASVLSHQIEGPDSCLECHKPEGRVWKNTAHYEGFFDLHRQPLARDLAQRLNIRRLKADNQCAACHYTAQVREGEARIIAGVSCESCHGPARDWISLHDDYAEGVGRKTETAEQKLRRIVRASEQGFRSPQFLYDLASRCYECHAVPDERMVNEGHPAGIDFELLAWTQGEIRHNFCSSPDQNSNPEASRERRRVLFVLGRILDLEHGLRGVAGATVKGDYAVSAARRVRDAQKNLEQVQELQPVSQIGRILALMNGMPLQLNQRDPMLAAAAQVKGLGREFLSAHDGSQLEALDGLLPKPSAYRGGEPDESAPR